MEIKAKVVFKRKRFPYGQIEHGDFAILTGDFIEVLEGEIQTLREKNIVFKGIVPEISFGEEYEAVMKFVEDPKWGRQYEFVSPPTLKVNLTDRDEQERFLRFILTEAQVNSLYDQLDNPFEVIKNSDVSELCEVQGIGEATASRIIAKYESTIDKSPAYLGLSNYGLTKNMIDKLVKHYESAVIALDKVKKNPYVLADEIRGIGWRKADEIARSQGIVDLDPRRIEAFILFWLKSQAEDGHSYVSPKELMGALESNVSIKITPEHTRPVLEDLYSRGLVFWDEDKTMVCLKKYYNLEMNIAKDLIRLKNSKHNFNNEGWQEVVRQIEKDNGWQFTDEQMRGIETVLHSQVVAITGFGGTGKTSVAEALLATFPEASKGLCALSGRASARLSETTGLEGMTIHRLLGYQPDSGFLHNRWIKHHAEIILLDETSMVGGALFNSLSQAISNGSKFILLGDDGQLEAIGALNVFKDVLESDVIPTVKLTQIHRQAQKSAIITDSINIRTGKQLFSQGWAGCEVRGELKDLKLQVFKDKEDTPFAVMENFKEQLEIWKDINEVQIVVPMRTRGDASVYNLNILAQQHYNSKEKGFGKQILRKDNGVDVSFELRPNDKVINRKNNRKTKNLQGELTPIWNGDLGIVEYVGSSKVIINFQQQGKVELNNKDLESVQLGYAITAHSAQGSQFKSVIIGIDNSAYTMLTREWLYTAVTRASKHCVLCGQSDAIRTAISVSRVPEKRTFLKHFLKELENESKIDFAYGEDDTDSEFELTEVEVENTKENPEDDGGFVF